MSQLPASGSVPPLAVGTPEVPGPLLVIVPSIFGLGPDVLRFCDRFAEAGALVMAFDPFWRQRTAPSSVETGAPEALALRRTHDAALTEADLRATLDWGHRHPLCSGPRIALGICFGGRFAFRAAAEGWVDGAATWHGGGLGTLAHLAPAIRVPIRLDFGGADPLIPKQEVEQLRAAFADHPSAAIHLHPGAGHGFSHRDTRACSPAAAEASARGLEALIDTLHRP